MRICYICTVIALMMVCIMPTQSILQFTYQCEGKNATATTYSYLKEPRIEENGFARGLKSGSFNYLENGNINLEENIEYYYGNGTNITNSTVNHDLSVEFEGDRGISEFFGRGYFANNRWVSAWKKIRYEESPNIRVNGWSMVPRPSNYINVEASVFMNSSENAISTYVFNYHADIENGAIETKDATGWTNRSGSRKDDWEYETRSVGKVLNITNDLVESEELITAGPAEADWLPCCFSGTMPTITMRDYVDYPWPSVVTIATLEANRLLPTRSLSTAYSIPSNDSPAYWKREIQIGLSSRPSVPVYNTEVSSIGLRKGARLVEGGVVASKANQFLPTMHLSTAYVPSVGYPVYWKREAQIGLRSSLPAVVPVRMTANSSPSVQAQEKTNVSLFASVPVQNPANCIGDNCPANFFVSKNQSDLSCKEGVCDGYDCIYTYDEDSGVTTTSGKSAPIRKGETRNIDVLAAVFELDSNASYQFYKDRAPVNAQKERYHITVANNGDVPLSDVSVVAEMAKGMMYDRSVLSSESGINSPLFPEGIPTEFDETAKTKLTWDLGIMRPNEKRVILMETYQKGDMNVDKYDLSVKVVGTSTDGILVRASVNNPEPACSVRLTGGAEISPALLDPDFAKLMEDKIKEKCPKWTTTQSI